MTTPVPTRSAPLWLATLGLLAAVLGGCVSQEFVHGTGQSAAAGAMQGVREFSFLNESRVGTLSQAVTAAADAANAIVNVEKQIAERDGGKPGLKLPKG